MQMPLEIAFRNCRPSDDIKAEIEKEAKRLDKFFGRITSCRVTVIGPNSHHRHGIPFKIDLRITMPGRKEIVISNAHNDVKEHEYLTVAIKDAFSAAQRKIEEAAHELRGEVKQHQEEASGRVSKFLAELGYGFIETPDGQEVYFSRASVLDDAFDRLRVGAEVRFVAESGEKGLQASTVRPICKHHLT
jgi:cold shock CspA family protein